MVHASSTISRTTCLQLGLRPSTFLITVCLSLFSKQSSHEHANVPPSSLLLPHRGLSASCALSPSTRPPDQHSSGGVLDHSPQPVTTLKQGVVASSLSNEAGWLPQEFPEANEGFGGGQASYYHNGPLAFARMDHTTEGRRRFGNNGARIGPRETDVGFFLLLGSVS